jgi:hypothetical protein
LLSSFWSIYKIMAHVSEFLSFCSSILNLTLACCNVYWIRWNISIVPFCGLWSLNFTFLYVTVPI